MKETGRFSKVKLEADHSNTDMYETDPFKALASFLADVEANAGNSADVDAQIQTYICNGFLTEIIINIDRKLL